METIIVIIKALVVTLGIGAFLGLLLAVADKYLSVKADPRLEVLLSMLPGANCGGCGYPGCSGMADSIISGSNKQVSLCKPLKKEKLAEIIEYLKSTPGPDGSVLNDIK